MLWYKAWLETRWRFLIGLALLLCSAAGVVLVYPQVLKLMPMVADTGGTGALGRRIREAADLAREFRGYIWAQWFGQNLAQIWTLFAVLLGTGGLLAQASGGAALFTLSMPASRRRLLGVRAAIGLVELAALAVVPSLLIPLVSPAIGQSYAFGDALVHAVCIAIAGAVFFSLAFLLSTVFSDLWRPLMLTLAIAFLISLGEELLLHDWPYGIYSVMSAETYFRGSGLPWIGLLVSAAVSAAMLYAASLNIERHDF